METPIKPTAPDNNAFEDMGESEEGKKGTSEKSIDHPLPDIGRPGTPPSK